MQHHRPRRVIKPDFVLNGAVLVGLRIVREDQLVRVFVVLEEIVDAVLFHQAGDEIESSFAILNYVFPLVITGLCAILKILKAMVLKDFFHDFGNSFLLKNLAIGGACEEPKPWHDFGAIVTVAIVATDKSKAAYKTVPVPLVVAAMMQTDGYALADDVLERNGMILREEVRGEMKELRDTLLGAEALKKQGVLTQRCVDRDESLFLCDRHIETALPSGLPSG